MTNAWRREDLVQPDQVHRDVYLDGGLFQLEMARLWRTTWIYLGHASELRQTPASLVRRIADCNVRMEGDSAHPRAVETATGGSLRHIHNHRGFVFVRLAEKGLSFAEHLGESLHALDTIADRSPSGKLCVQGPPLRTLVRANWKIYLENINDAVHPVSTHASPADAAQRIAATLPGGAPVPMSLQQLLPFGGGYDYFAAMGGRVLARGHSVLGTRHSIHTGYDDVPGYADAMQRAYGASRAQEILAFNPQNVVIYPSVAIKAAPQVLRVIRPLAVDRTLIEAWYFQPEGAAALLSQRGVLYNRLAFSPMSVVAHDDLHLFEGIQTALRSNPNPWVSLHRDARGLQDDRVSGVDEALLRNQYAAWREAMT